MLPSLETFPSPPVWHFDGPSAWLEMCVWLGVGRVGSTGEGRALVKETSISISGSSKLGN